MTSTVKNVKEQSTIHYCMTFETQIQGSDLSSESNGTSYLYISVQSYANINVVLRDIKYHTF